MIDNNRQEESEGIKRSQKKLEKVRRNQEKSKEINDL